MKLNRFAQMMVLGLVLAMAATGCRSKQGYFTRIPDSKKGGMNAGQDNASSGSLPGEGGIGGVTAMPTPAPTPDSIKAAGGIPQGPGHQGWVEDRNALQNDTVHFAFDSSAVTAADKSKVDAVADYLKSNAAAAVKIEGHCDERGTAEYNRALGERRALALREELVTQGVDAARIDTISYGVDRPVAAGHDEAAWSQNRRGEFVVLTPPAQ